MLSASMLLFFLVTDKMVTDKMVTDKETQSVTPNVPYNLLVRDSAPPKVNGTNRVNLLRRRMQE